MKIRLDYVSNSSSSSFMLVGKAYEDGEIKNGWLKIHPEDHDKLDEDADAYDEDLECDLADNLADELGLCCERGISDYYDCWVLGLPFDKMEDNETKKQFKERISTALERAFGKVKVDAIVDGGYEG